MALIFEPVLGMLLSSVAKRAVGQTWSQSQSIGMLLEAVVDFIVLLFLIFMATKFDTNSLSFVFCGGALTLSKEGWSFVFLIGIILAALFWKQSKAAVFATVKFKSDPNWCACLMWLAPNILMAFMATKFLFGVVAI